MFDFARRARVVQREAEQTAPMENHESEFMMRLRYQLVRARAVRDALLEEAQQIDVLVEAIELMLGGMEDHEET